MSGTSTDWSPPGRWSANIGCQSLWHHRAARNAKSYVAPSRNEDRVSGRRSASTRARQSQDPSPTTDLRERAYALVERYMPFSTAFLEASRVAAWAGSDLGNSTGWVHEEGDNLVFDYIMDMEDATSEKFLKGLARFVPKAIQ